MFEKKVPLCPRSSSPPWKISPSSDSPWHFVTGTRKWNWELVPPWVPMSLSAGLRSPLFKVQKGFPPISTCSWGFTCTWCAELWFGLYKWTPTSFLLLDNGGGEQGQMTSNFYLGYTSEPLRGSNKSGLRMLMSPEVIEWTPDNLLKLSTSGNVSGGQVGFQRGYRFVTKKSFFKR